MDISPAHSPQPYNLADPTDTAYNNFTDSSDVKVQSSVQSGDDATDVHSHFTVIKELSSVYGKVYEEQGLKEELFSLGLTSDSVNSSKKAFRGHRH